MVGFRVKPETRLRELRLERVSAERAQEQSVKNKDFVQLTRVNMEAVMDLIEKKPLCARIFIFLSKYMNEKNAVVCSNQVLEEKFNKSRMTIYRATTYLKKSGLVHILKSGNVNLYVMNPKVVWSALSNKKAYCEFKGSILISKKENEGVIEKLKSFTFNKANPRISRYLALEDSCQQQTT